uniref:RAB7B, member RAS oncogene family n=1 Tax=Anser cygnoides TaxID=8845 RepID=A0A8B9D9S4_ANSCY
MRLKTGIRRRWERAALGEHQPFYPPAVRSAHRLAQGPSMDASKKVDLKIIIIGALGVGKTSLLHQYVHKTFYEDYRTTLGASILTKVIAVDNTLLKMQVSKEIASAWCKEKDIPYFEVSAKNNINVAQAFETLAKQALTTYKGIFESYLTDSIKLTPDDKPKASCC